jgi:hypothetical protein
MSILGLDNDNSDIPRYRLYVFSNFKLVFLFSVLFLIALLARHIISYHYVYLNVYLRPF